MINFSRVAAKDHSHGREAVGQLQCNMSHVVAKESFAATRLVRRVSETPRPSAVAMIFRRYAAEGKQQ